MGFLNYEGLQHFYGKILSRFKTINTELSEITTTLGGKSDSNHTHNYAGSSSPGGSATSAVKLDTSAGSETNPVYFKDGKPVKTTYTLGKSVPSDAKFTDTTYNEATTSVAGLMSATDKSKLNGIDDNANNYTLPTASTTLGGVKTTSTVSDTTGYTACPIVSGVPYYKDTNNTYTLSSFGITSTANELNILDGVTATTAELNYVDGVTSNIQTQLNGKVPTSRTINGKALSGNITLTASDVSADASGSANTALTNAKSYTDTKISNLINGAPSTLDTLKEIADAMADNEDVVKALETSIGTKQDKITGGATTITSSNLTASRALVSDANGKVAVSAVTSTELGYLDGVTSAIQTQLNGKLSTTGTAANASRLSNTSAIGSTTQPVYFNANGVPVATTYTLGASVPSGAKFTDTVYTHPSYTAKSSGLYKITVDATGHVSATSNVTKSDITGLGIPGSDTTYSAATTSTAGLMSAADKSKLDGIASGANAYSHPNSGVTAGTYRSVTVNATGHVTAGSNPTIAVAQGGTGATDAATARTNLGLGNAATYTVGIDISTNSILIPSEIIRERLSYKLDKSGGVMDANTNYTTNQVRNTVFTSTDPGANVSSTYANGSIIAVYE